MQDQSERVRFNRPAHTRRSFLMSAASLATGLSLGTMSGSSVQAQPMATKLVVGRRTIEVAGKAASVFGIRQPNGSSGLFLERGERFAVDLSNTLEEETILHWHGQTPPWPQDGVVSLENPSLRAGASRSYDYEPRPGTHWMHSHVGLQEQLLLAAPLIVRTAEDRAADVQEVTILLADFTFRDPAEVLQELKGSRKMEGMDSTTGKDPHSGMPGMAPMASMPESAMPDLNDVEYDAYLANDRTLDDPEVVLVESRGRVRLRLINGATTSAFHIDLGALEGSLVAVDGNAVQPISGRDFTMSMAQRLDILLEIPPESGAWPILAQREGDVARTGIILATRRAPVLRVSGESKLPAAPIDMSLEQRLVALAPLPKRAPDASYRVRLTGDMRTYVWSMDDRTWGDHRPLPVRSGQRVLIEMRNETAMSHPMHLHGHHFQVLGINGKAVNGAVRDTVLVPGRGSVVIAFDADNPGRWLLHCHNLLHRDVGMQTEVPYVT
jgi:FtsP/CotA-like multicopper oxidase with cupredoxin domain